MTFDEKAMRPRVLKRAEAIGLSAACRDGISQTLFYRWQHRFQRYGLDGLHPRRRRAPPEPAPQLPPAVERRVLAVVIAGATWGAQRLAAYVQRLRRLRIVATTAQRLLRRHAWRLGASGCWCSSTTVPAASAC